MSYIYDCFMFSDELETLELRMKILEEYVDRFVIVEGTRNLNNKKKELFFNINRERFKKWEDKIIHIVVDDWPEYDNAWTYEHYQRNSILRGLVQCEPNDVIIISDVDEIPAPNVIKKARKLLSKKRQVYNIRMFRFMYFYNYFCYTEPYWYAHPKIFRFEEFQIKHKSFSNEYGQGGFGVATTPDQMRTLAEYSKSLWGGWHFSTVGDIERIKRTISSLSVADEYDESGLWEKSKVAKSVEDGVVPNRPQYRLCSTLSTIILPQELLVEQSKYITMGLVTDLNGIKALNIIQAAFHIVTSRMKSYLRDIKRLVVSK